MGYAHAEDDFLTIQQSLAAARGELASVYGLDAAPIDYMVKLLRIWDVFEARYESDMLPGPRAIHKAIADGINHYDANHPEEVLAVPLFPVSGKDLVAASVHKSPLVGQRQLTPVWFDEVDIRANLEREYRPGEEIAS